MYPKFTSIGGSLGRTISFAGINMPNLTGDVYNLRNLVEKNNGMCFAYQFLQQVAINILRDLFSGIDKPVSKLSSALATVISQIGFPQLEKIDKDHFKQFPGAKGAY
ncbi:hypothetical protein VTL71DRAFT_937 [Oculimacula yallundae]|uniref:Uncharacterized protein n=1 Tax=Oculimacula yallundae TaxID=86028 RepID=A0ABR4D3T0_9HELO